MGINSIFKEPIPKEPIHPLPQKKTAPSSGARKVRSDKLHDIKFPVSVEQRERLRRIAKKMKERETISNSILLTQAIQTLREIPLLPYQDTKRYMHVKLNAKDYEIISNLAIKKDMSERKVVSMIMWDLIERSKRGEI